MVSDLVDTLRNNARASDASRAVCQAMEDAADEIERLTATLRVGEVFLDKCFSAWSCGEPEHRVKTMLDAAGNFRAALNELDN